jgi:hypothetical protein
MSSIPTAWRQQVAERSGYRCNYCQSQQRLMGVSLTIDHIMPQSLGGETELDNLCQACWDCNLIKGDRTTGIDLQTGMPVRLFNPNQQKWLDHFRWSEDGAHVIGVTPVGQATVIALKLNRPQLVEARRYWVKAGWHPPTMID